MRPLEWGGDQLSSHDGINPLPGGDQHGRRIRRAMPKKAKPKAKMAAAPKPKNKSKKKGK